MATIAARSGGAWRIAVAATLTLLLALVAFALLASPALAAGTVTLSVQGKGDVTGPGIDCNESGGPDCSDFYDDVVVGQGECDTTVRPPVCEVITEPPQITFTAGPDRNGYTLDGWNGCDSATGRTCSFTVDADRAVTARFRDSQGPSVGADNASVTVDEGQTATNTGSYSDNASGDVAITASRGTVTKTGTNNGTWSWSQATDDGPTQGGPVTITTRDQSGNSLSITFGLTVRNVAPTATFNAPQTSYANKTFVISMTNPSDPSSVDSSSLTYAFDCGSGYGSFSSVKFASCQSGAATKTVKGKVRDKDGGETEYTRTVTVNAGPSSPPNGRIAFISGRDGNQEIYTMNSADGSGLRRLTHTGAAEANVAYSPDGKKIAYDREGEIYVMNANGTEQTRLTNVSGSDILPAFSPDGTKIAFQSNRNGFGEIYVMNADGSNPTRLTSNTSTDTDPDFSPNGSQIAFTTSRDGADEVYVMNADGTGQTNVVNNPNAGDLDPTYSAFDGSRLIFQSHRTGNGEIFGMQLGFNQTNLTNNPAADVQPTYAPFSFQMAFASTRDNGNWEIYKMDDFNGANPTRLTNNPALDEDPSWGGASDTTAPQTIINSPPPSFSNSTSATIGFISSPNEASPAFECQLDSGAFEPCTSTKTYNNLAAGQHTFSVRAIDTSGNEDPTPESRTWTVDRTAPDTTITGPSGFTANNKPTFNFGGSDNVSATPSLVYAHKVVPNGTPEGSVAYSTYSTSTNATLGGASGLSDGGYTIFVKSRDQATNEDPSPSQQSFTVDTTGPSLNITTGPDGQAFQPSQSRTWTFAASDAPGASGLRNADGVQCKIEPTGSPGAYGPCNGGNSSHTFPVNLDEGDYRFWVRATDNVGNTTERSRNFSIDSTPPAAPNITSRPDETTNVRTAVFAFSAEAGATFQCSIDDPSNFSACTSGQEFQVQADGPHTFRVKAVDGAGNVSPVAQAAWTVDSTKPTLDTDKSDGSDGVTPDNGARNVKRNVNITATFSEVMDLQSIREAGVFTLKNTRTGALVSPATNGITLSSDGRTVTFNPAPLKLAKKTKYEVRITTGAKDKASNAMQAEAVWSFTTGRK